MFWLNFNNFPSPNLPPYKPGNLPDSGFKSTKSPSLVSLLVIYITVFTHIANQNHSFMPKHMASLFLQSSSCFISLYPLLYWIAFLARHFLHSFHSELICTIFLFPSLSMQFHRACLVLWYSVLCCNASIWPSWGFFPFRGHWRRITEIPIFHSNV